MARVMNNVVQLDPLEVIPLSSIVHSASATAPPEHSGDAVTWLT
jgi:hypothetical protein